MEHFAALAIGTGVWIGIVAGVAIVFCVIGIFVGRALRKKFAEAEIGSAEQEAVRIREEAAKTAPNPGTQRYNTTKKHPRRGCFFHVWKEFGLHIV